jgi:SAM-dependent methyltransferase
VKAQHATNDSTRRFSDRVEYYVQSRPKYPPALLQFCQEKLGLRPGHVVADIGSGTGILSQLFLENGNLTLGVEPNGPMRSAAEASLAIYPNFQSVEGTAEATNLAESSIDFVIAGQAFHWFDRPRTRFEFRRILRPGGWVLLVWNDRRLDAGGFAGDYERVVQEFESDLKHVSHRRLTSSDATGLSEFFGAAGFALEKFDNPQYLDLDGVLARAWSSSYLPLPCQPRSDLMEQRLRAAFADHAVGGKVRQDYTTELFYGQLG